MDVLDFGCGTGLLILTLQPLVRSMTGVDSSQGMLDVLNAKIKNQDLTQVKTPHRDLDKGDVLEGSYHLIVSSMTLHHIREIRPLLDKFSKACAPDGYLSSRIWIRMAAGSTATTTAYSISDSTGR